MNKVAKSDIDSIKDEGNKAFKNENYYKAIMLYEEGIRRCGEYGKSWKELMPYKNEIGNSPILTDGSMYY